MIIRPSHHHIVAEYMIVSAGQIPLISNAKKCIKILAEPQAIFCAVVVRASFARAVLFAVHLVVNGDDDVLSDMSN